MNRKADPNICFVRGSGSRVWDLDGNEYIDYHAAFSAAFLGHNDPDVNEAVAKALREERVLMGAGPTELEGELSELICSHMPGVQKVQLTNSGSEATYHAIRLARAATGRAHIVIMQGGYNGWHNDVAANVSSSLDNIGMRVSPGEYRYDGLSAGVPSQHRQLVHIVNFNDLDSVLDVVRRVPVACVITEPVLQNIGIVKPLRDYLSGLRAMADEHGFLLIFDEVKTGFRHALGGYQSLCGVVPDLSTFGKAIANGYPLGVIGGRSEYMDLFIHPDPNKRVLIAGTYNAHPLATAASIATIRKLASPEHDVYRKVEALADFLISGLRGIFQKTGVECRVVQQKSAFCVYFMEHEPRDYHDLAAHHDSAFDLRYRRGLIDKGIYHFPLPTKQGSLSFAHTTQDIEQTLSVTRAVVQKMVTGTVKSSTPAGVV